MEIDYKAEIEKIREAEERMQLLLDSSPLVAHFWDENFNIVDCNEAAVKLFDLSSKQEYLDRYFELTPEFQPDGSRSKDRIKELISKTFDEGYHKTDWMRCKLNGEPIPVEVTYVRVEYKGQNLIAAYCRDLRSHNRMMADIEKQGKILNTMNQVAFVLLAATDEGKFEDSLHNALELIGQCLDADCVQIWPNEMIGDTLHFALKYKWLSEAGKQAPDVPIGTAVPYPESWLDLFDRDECINGPIAKLPQVDQDLLGPLGLVSTITIPLYYQNEFWGVFCVDDCVKERYFAENEIGILRSAALMLLNAINRNMQLKALSDAQELNELQLTKLNAVLKATKVGLWDMEIIYDDPVNPQNVFNWSDELRHMLGYEDENDFPNVLSSWSDCIYPDDKERILDSFEKHIMDFTGKTPYDFECRLIKKDGEVAYFRDCGETIRDADGRPIRIAGALIDVNETRSLIREIENRRKEAEDANKAKSTFLSTMSHEIRTPMNAILGITDIELQKQTLDQDIRGALEKIYASGDLLLGIINDILDLSKIEAGKLELAIARYEIASLISDTAQLNILRIGSKPIEFELSVDEQMPAYMAGDELRIKQILNNVLSNAFKYTAEGTVRLSVGYRTLKNNDDQVILVLSVSDTGQGMSKEQVNKLFDEYTRFNAEANRSTEGTGLGMNITKNLIRLMDGEIHVESELGKGSVFTVDIPQGKVETTAIGKEITENLHLFRNSSWAHMKRIQVSREPMPYGRVLIVDDVDTNIYVAKGLLSPYGLNIDSVDSGFAAIEKIKQGNEYDIVFMDHMMPKMDGVEATKIIRDSGYDLPVVALTANAVAGQADIFLKNGFDDFISKPIDVRQLNFVLNKLIRDKQPPEVIEAARQQNGFTNGAQDAEGLPEPGVDPQLIELFLQDANKALDIIGAIIEKGSPYSEDDIRMYIIYTHGVKTALANVNKPDLSATALKLEHLGRENNTGSIAAETPAFLSALKAFVDELTPQEEEAAEEPATENEQLLREKLQEIKAACEDWDKEIARAALTALKEEAWTKRTRELLDKISEQLLHSDFDEIVEEIDKF